MVAVLPYRLGIKGFGMGITRKFLMGGCALALSVAFTGNADARNAAAKCAGPADVTAMQVAAIQQNLMVSALTCGDLARTNFNAFQTNFGPDLRKSDKALLAMFRRILGRGGDAAYNLFKTDLASKAELRRIHGHAEFCSAADQIASMALAPEKPKLADFVVGAPPIDFSGPIAICEVLTATATGSGFEGNSTSASAGTAGVSAAISIVGNGSVKVLSSSGLS